MPTLNYDGSSFIWNTRRLWLVGANLEYALLAPERWSSAIASLKQMGINTIRASVPWCLHEISRDRFRFDHALDLAAFTGECTAQGMHLVLRIGPVVGEPFDCGGIPAWISAEQGAQSRQVNEVVMGRTSKFFQAIAAQVAPLQATIAQRNAGFGGGRAQDGGALLAVQIEQGWNCGNEKVGVAYHAELLRFVRECGFTVPVLTNNGLWISVQGCIEIWEGWNDLFSHLRQLQTVQPNAPRLIEIREEVAKSEGMHPQQHETANRGVNTGNSAVYSTSKLKRVQKEKSLIRTTSAWPIGMEFLSRMGQILAAGGQPILPGVQRTDRSNAVPALLDAGGRPNPALRSLRRMVSFANHFGHVYAEANASRQTSVQAPDALQPGGFSVIVVEGRAGRVNFVFRGADKADGERIDATTLITKEGGRLHVQLGDAPVGWYLFDVSLHGRATLDWCNLSPFALIDQSMLVLQGPAGATGALSMNGGELHFQIPQPHSAEKPLVIKHQGMVIVVCNQQQIDATVVLHNSLVVGAERVLSDGSVQLANGFTRAVRVLSDGVMKSAPIAKLVKPTAKAFDQWQTASCQDHTRGVSDRFAPMKGAASLTACGAYTGWGWYRLQWKQGKSALFMPGARGFMQAWLDAKSLGALHEQSLPLKVAAGSRTLVVLARQGGQSAATASAGRATGISNAPHGVELMSCTTQVVKAAMHDPFKSTAFIAGYAPGEPMSAHAVRLQLQHRRKESIVLDASGESIHALVVLNGNPHAVIDWRSELGDCLVLPITTREAPKIGLQPGKNEVLLIPFKSQPAEVQRMAKKIRVFNSLQILEGKQAQWSFARWQPPLADGGAWSQAKAVNGNEPRWFQTTFKMPTLTDAPIALRCDGLSRGDILLNDQLVGSYDLADGRDVVELPREKMLNLNTLVIFDLQGRMPTAVRLLG